jgi:hypothetical protein
MTTPTKGSILKVIAGTMVAIYLAWGTQPVKAAAPPEPSTQVAYLGTGPGNFALAAAGSAVVGGAFGAAAGWPVGAVGGALAGYSSYAVATYCESAEHAMDNMSYNYDTQSTLDDAACANTGAIPRFMTSPIPPRALD